MLKTLTNQIGQALNKSEKKLTFNIPKASGRRLVISDIHGCSKTFRELVDKIALTKSDQLFLLGDFIDRGLDSKGVLDFMGELAEEGFQLFPILGNHEQMLLEISKQHASAVQTYAIRNRIENLITPEGKLQPVYKDFLESLPYYYELADFYIVHAGFNFQAPNPFADFTEMLWIRDFKADKDWIGDRIVVHGHTPVYKSVIMESIHNRHSIIPLDNGCVFSPGGISEDYGNLLCLNLDTFEVISQPNLHDVVS
ncbi:MAG: serine/threonine protein phosphatase 1 [Flammeovirgaceae bacterium]|jgi:serine/threonine protein phosphatase 1